MAESTALEAALKRDRLLIGTSLAVAILLSWAWIVPMARDMYGPMTGSSSWMMSGEWNTRYVLLLFAMWTVMMAGMMLPSAAPTLLLYAAVVRKSATAVETSARVYAFACGYLAIWTAFSVVVTVLQLLLSKAALLSPMMELQAKPISAGVLLVAGVYQLTPFKRGCLAFCRSPLAFVTRQWRNGSWGAFQMGLAHGLLCLGCCWALMLLLFVGGVMNLYVIAAITVLVLIEKLAPLGAQGGRLSGLLLIAAGIALLLSA
jgi:predicted metal-binding membrane protein